MSVVILLHASPMSDLADFNSDVLTGSLPFQHLCSFVAHLLALSNLRKVTLLVLLDAVISVSTMLLCTGGSGGSVIDVMYGHVQTSMLQTVIKTGSSGSNDDSDCFERGFLSTL